MHKAADPNSRARRMRLVGLLAALAAPSFPCPAIGQDADNDGPFRIGNVVWGDAPDGIDFITADDTIPPPAVMWDGSHAYVPNRDAGTISVVDLLNDETDATIEVCPGPTDGALTPDQVTYIVACGGSDELVFINTASFAVTGRVSEGLGARPSSIVVPDRGGCTPQRSRRAGHDPRPTRDQRAVQPGGRAQPGPRDRPRLLADRNPAQPLGPGVGGVPDHRHRRGAARAPVSRVHAGSLPALARAGLRGHPDGGLDADDPRWIHTAAYDEAYDIRMRTYARLFDRSLGPGGWVAINASHWANIERALDRHRGEGARFLLTYGAGHKGPFLRELRKRDDIVLLDVGEFLDGLEGK